MNITIELKDDWATVTADDKVIMDNHGHGLDWRDLFVTTMKQLGHFVTVKYSGD